MSENTRSWPTDIFILIPAYKAAGSLREFLPRLITTVPHAQIIVVDDGSLDETPDVCRNNGIRCLMHNVNRGKGAALRTGFAALAPSNARWIVTMDADGQHAVEDLPAFLDAIDRFPGTGLIIGRRDFRLSKMPLDRIMSNTLTSAALSLLAGAHIPDSQCGYRAYNRRLLDAVTIECDYFEAESEIILKACRRGFPIRSVPVRTLYFYGSSHISRLRDTIRWIRSVMKIRWRSIFF